jgi:hypothetical protein
MPIQASVTKATVDKYEVRSASGDHASIYVESGQHVDDPDPNGGWGRITIQSSFGAFAYYWGSCGRDFGKFLAGLDFDYAMKNLRNYRHRVYDHRETKTHIRKVIIDDRKKHDLTKDQARKAWVCLREADGYDQPFLIQHLMNSGLLFYADVAQWGPMTKYDEECVLFWKHIWPLFIAEITKAMK